MTTSRDFRLIIGDFNDTFVEIIAEAVSDALETDHRLDVHGTCDADRMLAIAERATPDLFVLFLNNLKFCRWGSDIEAEPFVRALMLVQHLKAAYHAPVIATAAFPDAFTCDDIAIRFGADRFLRMPFDIRYFSAYLHELFPERSRQMPHPNRAPLMGMWAGNAGFRA